MAYTYRRTNLSVVPAADVNAALNRADSESNSSPFVDGDEIHIPVNVAMGEHEWECLDENGNPVKDRKSKGSFIVVTNGKFSDGTSIEEIALSLFKTKKAFSPAKDGSRPSVNGLCAYGSRPSVIWAAIKAAPTVGTGSARKHVFIYKSIEYLGADDRYHTISAIQLKP